MDSWAHVASTTRVYVGLEHRHEFDRIALPVVEHPPNANGLRCATKTLERDGVTVVFQHWEGLR